MSEHPSHGHHLHHNYHHQHPHQLYRYRSNSIESFDCLSPTQTVQIEDEWLQGMDQLLTKPKWPAEFYVNTNLAMYADYYEKVKQSNVLNTISALYVLNESIHLESHFSEAYLVVTVVGLKNMKFPEPKTQSHLLDKDTASTTSATSTTRRKSSGNLKRRGSSVMLNEVGGHKKPKPKYIPSLVAYLTVGQKTHRTHVSDFCIIHCICNII